MAKLPDNYVKAPTAKKPKATAPQAKRPRKRASKLGLEQQAAARLHEIVLRMSPDEHAALGRACAELRAAGEDVTEEVVVKRAVAFWLAERSAPQAVASEQAEQDMAVDGVVAQLRRLAQEPMRRWRDLNATLRRIGAFVGVRS